ncbi:hypothetical protein Tco_1340059 [Tanacetum coccineum]
MNHLKPPKPPKDGGNFGICGGDRGYCGRGYQARACRQLNKSKLISVWAEIKDKGCGDVEIVNKRANVVRSLQELENLQSLEAAQKSKIKWAIEGDENSKYYHRILNKKRSQLAIRGILVDDSRLQLDLNFPNTLQPDQIIDLECDVSKDEIKRAVWDCGTDKSPGPDGFTFGFYRRY